MEYILAFALFQFPVTEELVKFIDRSIKSNSCQSVTVLVNSDTRSAKKLVYDLSSLNLVAQLLDYEQIDRVECQRFYPTETMQHSASN